MENFKIVRYQIQTLLSAVVALLVCTSGITVQAAGEFYHSHDGTCNIMAMAPCKSAHREIRNETGMQVFCPKCQKNCNGTQLEVCDQCSATGETRIKTTVITCRECGKEIQRTDKTLSQHKIMQITNPCNLKEGQTIGRLQVENLTPQWTKGDVTLQARVEIMHEKMKLDPCPYAWMPEGVRTTDGTRVVKENGVYQVAAFDRNQRKAVQYYEVRNIDRTVPKIHKISLAENGFQKKATICVNALDEQSGLHNQAYSLDGKTWRTENTLPVTENGSYTIYVRDKVENVIVQQFKVTSIDKEAPVIQSVKADSSQLYADKAFIVIQAADTAGGSGLHAQPYSWDGGKTWSSNNSFWAYSGKQYTIVVRDALLTMSVSKTVRREEFPYPEKTEDKKPEEGDGTTPDGTDTDHNGSSEKPGGGSNAVPDGTDTDHSGSSEKPGEGSSTAPGSPDTGNGEGNQKPGGGTDTNHNGSNEKPGGGSSTAPGSSDTGNSGSNQKPGGGSTTPGGTDTNHNGSSEKPGEGSSTAPGSPDTGYGGGNQKPGGSSSTNPGSTGTENNGSKRKPGNGSNIIPGANGVGDSGSNRKSGNGSNGIPSESGIGDNENNRKPEAESHTLPGENGMDGKESRTDTADTADSGADTGHHVISDAIRKVLGNRPGNGIASPDKQNIIFAESGQQKEENPVFEQTPMQEAEEELDTEEEAARNTTGYASLSQTAGRSLEIVKTWAATPQGRTTVAVTGISAGVVGLAAVLFLLMQSVTVSCYDDKKQYHKLGKVPLIREEEGYSIRIPEFMLEMSETTRYRLHIPKWLVKRMANKTLFVVADKKKMEVTMEECVDFVM